MDKTENADSPKTSAEPDPRSAWDADLQGVTAPAPAKQPDSGASTIELGNPYAAPAGGRPVAEADQAKPVVAVSAPAEWTVAVDLAWHANANQPQLEAQKIAALKEESRDKSVDIIVQAYEPGKSADGKDEMHIERLLIRNGQVTDLGQQASRGEAQDLTDLLQFAGAQAPSKNLALVFNDDGAASLGFGGDLPPLTMPQFNQAIVDGLKGGSHSKLDVLDFDACIMGDTAVLDKSSSISNHVVASSEVESGRVENGVITSAGQDVTGVLKDLLARPGLTSGQLADDFVKRADDQARQDKQSAGADFVMPENATLAHFDMSKMDQFESSLDRFGAALAAAGKTPANLDWIKLAVNASEELARPMDRDAGSGRQHDLKSFVGQIQLAIKDGKLPDPDGTIGRAASDLLSQQQHLTASSHLEQDPIFSYKDQGGLATFLPDSNFAKYFHSQNPLTELEEMSAGPSHRWVRPEDRQTYLAPFDQGIERLKERTPAELQSQLEPLIAARNALSQSKDDSQFAQNYLAFNRTVWSMMHSDTASNLNRQDQAEMDRWFAASGMSQAPGWNAFIAQLKPSDKQ